MRVNLIILCVVSVFSFAEAEEPAAGAPHTYEEVVALLPPSERYHFLAVNPKWGKRVIVKGKDPSGIRVQKSSERIEQPLRIYYYDKATAEIWCPYVKTLEFYPTGKLFRETDDVLYKTDGREERFSRSFFPDSSCAGFLHQRSFPPTPGDPFWIAGVALNPETKQESHFSNGEGSLLMRQGTTSITQWFHGNRIYLEVERDGPRRTRCELKDGYCNTLFVTRDEEQLRQERFQRKEVYWTLEEGGTPVWRRNISITQVADMEMMLTEAGENEGIERQQILALWKNIYDNQRRPAFIKQYTQLLAAAGQSWQSLDIEFIRDRTPWPEQ